jgi:hypothetical protein
MRGRADVWLAASGLDAVLGGWTPSQRFATLFSSVTAVRTRAVPAVDSTIGYASYAAGCTTFA